MILMVYNRSEDRVMEQIRAAMARASDPAASENEKELSLKHAKRLMQKHAIDQAMLDASRAVGERRVPTSMRIKLWDHTYEWHDYFLTIISELGRTNRCKIGIHNNKDVDATIVGMQEDVEWTQLLWMQIFFEFVSKIEPKWLPQKTMGENVLALKEAGFKWEDIWRTFYHVSGGNTPDGLSYYDPKKASYLMREYQKELKRTGRTAVATARFAAYRASFVASFSDRVSTRLEEMRAEMKAEQDSVPGSAVALRDLSGIVDEEYYRLFPGMRPLTDQEYALLQKQMNEHAKETKEKDDEFLASLSESERKRVLGEREKEKRRQARQDESYWRNQDRMRANLFDDAGFSAGRRAANEVNLSRSKATEASPDKKEINQ